MASRRSSDHDAPPGIPPSPAAAGPPWPNLIAPGDAPGPPRIARWLVVAGIVLVAGGIAATARAARRFRALAKPSFRVPTDSQRRPFHRHVPQQTAPH